MQRRRINPANLIGTGFAAGWALALCLSAGEGWARAQAPASKTTPARPAPDQPPDRMPERMLDRVIAVVNSQVILASDLELEMRMSHLAPGLERRESTPAKALERMTARALIEQQIVQEDPNGMKISPAELEASLDELRQNLPACKRIDCSTQAGWAAYLATLGVTPEQAAAYWSRRMAVLRFIEQRFRAGIRIAPEEIKKYYEETLLPQYANPGQAPPLERIAPRIQEILLQQQVNALLADWLKSMQDQGQVEVLDPALRDPAAEDAKPGGTGGER